MARYLINDEWDIFLAPYEQAVNELKLKLRDLRGQFKKSGQRSPIEYVTGRVKPPASINEKMKRRCIKPERVTQDMEDIAGIRVMCQFVEDIYYVVKLLRKRKDMQVIEERDYIKAQKASGYRSYHIVILYPVQLLNEERHLKVEIQVRTLAMNFWATIEHSLNYKYQGCFPKELEQRLQKSAEIAFALDKEMSSIREEVNEAQSLFDDKQKRLD